MLAMDCIYIQNVGYDIKYLQSLLIKPQAAKESGLILLKVMIHVWLD